MLLMLFGPLWVIAFAAQADGPTVGARHVWIRESSSAGPALKGYLTLQNFSGAPLELIHVASPDFRTVTVVQSVRGSGVKPLAELVIPVHPRTVFAPGGTYLLLTQPPGRLFEGDLVTLTLVFSDHSTLTIMAPIRRGAPAH